MTSNPNLTKKQLTTVSGGEGHATLRNSNKGRAPLAVSRRHFIYFFKIY